MTQGLLLASLGDRLRTPPSVRRFRLVRRGGAPRILASFAALMLTASMTDGGPRAETTPAVGPAGKSLALTYEVYAGGLHAFTFNVDLTLDPADYRIAAGGETRGLIGVLYDWKVRMTAEGAEAARSRDAADTNGLQPQRYVTVNAGRREPRTMRLEFAPAGAYSVTRDPADSQDMVDDDDELPSQLPKDILDPLSAALAATRSLAESGRCDQTVAIFDGKRRFDLTFLDAGAGDLPKSRLSAYAGPAIRCGMTMKRISGFSTKRRYAGRWDEEKVEPPMLWIARVRQDLPPVPVRFTGAIALGSIVVHLAKIEPGRQLAAGELR
jgi:hypothetical protein